MSDDPFGDLLSAPKPEETAAPATLNERMGAITPKPVSEPNDDPFGALLSKPPAAPEKPDQGPAPDWSQIPGKAASNFLPDLGGVIKDTAHAIVHPIETAKTIGSVGLGYMEKAGKNLGLPSGQGYEQYADAMNNMIYDHYGTVDNFKRTLAEHPAQAMMDISTVFTGVGGTAGKLPGIAGKVGERVAAVGSTIDPMNVVTKPVMGLAKGTTSLAKNLIGERTGAGPEAVEAAAKAGFQGGEPAQAFRENLRGKTDIASPVEDAMEAMHNIVSDKNSTYAQGMAQAGLDQPIRAASFQKIAKGILDAGDISTVKAGNQTWRYSPDAIRANSDIQGIVREFLMLPPQFHTVQGLDGLKQAISKYQESHKDFGTDAGVVAGKVHGAVLDAIKTQAPKYAEVMESYGEAKTLLKQLQSSFSLPLNERKVVVDTALRKLQSVMRNNANTNYGYRKSLMQNLEENGAPNLTYKLAGQALSSASPRGISKVAVEKGAEIGTALFGLFTGNPTLMGGALKAAGITYLTSTPRLAGEAAYYAGRIAKPTSKVLNRPNARVLYQAGRLENYNGQARGGRIARALRATKR